MKTCFKLKEILDFNLPFLEIFSLYGYILATLLEKQRYNFSFMKLYPRTCFCCYYWILEITIFPSRHTTSFQGFPKIARAFYAEPGKLIWFLLVSVLKKMRTRPLIKQTETMPSDCNWTRTQNHLVHKRTLNNLATSINSRSLKTN